MGRLRVLIAVAPRALARIVEHVLDGDARFRVVQRLTADTNLARRAQRAAPNLVVANLRFLGREHVRILEGLRRSSPTARVLLLHTYAMPRSLGGAHMHLDEQAVVRRLLPALHGLAGGAGQRRPRGA